MKIKSKQTGLEQTVSKKTFENMEALKPGLHKVLEPDAPTPPEVIALNAKADAAKAGEKEKENPKP